MTITYNFDGYEYEYEPDEDDLFEYVSGLFAREHLVSEASAKEIIEEYDLLEAVCDYFDDTIEKHFCQEAYRQFKSDKEYNDDKYGYLGISESDFH